MRLCIIRWQHNSCIRLLAIQHKYIYAGNEEDVFCNEFSDDVAWPDVVVEQVAINAEVLVGEAPLVAAAAAEVSENDPAPEAVAVKEVQAAFVGRAGCNFPL